jgi:hypothetical protein
VGHSSRIHGEFLLGFPALEATMRDAIEKDFLHFPPKPGYATVWHEEILGVQIYTLTKTIA